MKSTITLVLILALVVPASARERTPLEQAKKISRGSAVRVDMKNQHAVAGRLGEVTKTQFTLEPMTTGSRQEILFQDVLMIRSIELTKTQILMWPLQVFVYCLFCGLGTVFRRPCNL
jgi:hypothetical protein